MGPKETESFLQMEWAAISAAPFLFITALAVIGGGIWLASRFFCKQQITGLENENRAKDETIRTLGERISLAQEKFEASDEARKNVETMFNDLEDAVERDAAQRDQEVSADVKVATTATEGAMEGLKKKEDEVRDAFIDFEEIFRKWGLSDPKPFTYIDYLGHLSEDEAKGKDKD